MKYILILTVFIAAIALNLNAETNTLKAVEKHEYAVYTYIYYLKTVKWQWQTPNENIKIVSRGNNELLEKQKEFLTAVGYVKEKTNHHVDMVNHFAKEGWRFIERDYTHDNVNKITMQEFWFERLAD